MNSLKRTVLELLLGIALFGIVFEGVGILFVKEKASYTIGILCGVLIAVFLALHMAYNLNEALDWDEENARKSVKKGAAFRYLLVILMTVGIAYFRIGNILACCLGIMSLKTSAYIQPFVHKIINKIYQIEEGGSENAIIDDDDEFDFSEWAERGFHGSWADKTKAVWSGTVDHYDTCQHADHHGADPDPGLCDPGEPKSTR